MNDKVMNGMYTYTHDGIEEEIKFEFNTDLRTSQKLRFVNAVSNVLVGDDYNSILRDLVFDFFLVHFFADIDMTQEIIDSSFFVDDAEKFLEETNALDIILTSIEPGVVGELNDAVDNNIAYKTGIHKTPFDDLSKALASLVNTLEEKTKSIDTDKMMEMVKTFSGMTGDITPDSIVNAYINSDIFKQNAKEIKESKEQHRKQVEELGVELLEETTNLKNKIN